MNNVSSFKNAVFSFLKSIGQTFKNKGSGFYVAAVAWVLSLAHTVTYSCVPQDIYNVWSTVWGIAGIILFICFSLFPKFSVFAPISLMVSSIMCLMSAAAADGIIDYLSTRFFDGISVQKIFALPFSVWFSVLSFVVAFILASVAMYLPQSKNKLSESTQIVSAEEKI